MWIKFFTIIYDLEVDKSNQNVIRLRLLITKFKFSNCYDNRKQIIVWSDLQERLTNTRNEYRACNG